MKITATAIAAVVLATASQAQAGLNGTADYHFEFSSNTASLGDTVTVTVVADYVGVAMPFLALNSSAFNVEITDVLGGGSIDSRAVHTDFAAFGSTGVVIGDDIIGVGGVQLVPLQTASTLDLFTFDYTILDAAPRFIDFDVTGEENNIFYGPSMDFLTTYTPSSTTGQIEVVALPAPGAAALLGIAGLAARGRRRRES